MASIVLEDKSSSCDYHGSSQNLLAAASVNCNLEFCSVETETLVNEIESEREVLSERVCKRVESSAKFSQGLRRTKASERLEEFIPSIFKLAAKVSLKYFKLRNQ